MAQPSTFSRATNEPDLAYKCGRCGGSQLRTLAWVNAQTNEFAEPQDGEPLDHWWCVDCDDHPSAVIWNDEPIL